MCWRSKEKPSFFKVLSNMDFRKLLRLPRKYELTLPENVKLRVDDSGRRWNVRVEPMDDGLFCFTNGWEKFAEDADLKLGEFLVFSLLSRSEFSVLIYETSCCKREIPNPSSESNAHGEGDKTESGIKRGRGRPPLNRKRGTTQESPLYFEKRVETRHRYRLNLPNEFSAASDMKAKEQVRMKFVGNRRRASHVVAVDPRPQDRRTDLAKGWHEFRVANGIEFGKIYCFEFNPDNQVIYVDEVDSPE